MAVARCARCTGGRLPAASEARRTDAECIQGYPFLGCFRRVSRVGRLDGMTPTKRHSASMRTRRAVSMASRMLPPPPVDGLSRSSRDRPILGLAWRRASNRATTQASVHCICTAQATTHGRKTRPVAGEWCLGCVAAAAVPRRSVPSCPAVQLSHCPDSCLVRGPDGIAIVMHD